MIETRIKRAAQRAGGNCGVCRRPLRHCEITTIGHIRGNRRLVLAGDCCADRLADAVGGSVYISKKRETPWQIADRAWFEEHRDRSHRIRPAFPDEIPAPWVVVRQIEPGLRHRLGFDPPAPPPDDEHLAHVLFDTVAEATAAGRNQISAADIFERLQSRGAGGRA